MKPVLTLEVSDGSIERTRAALAVVPVLQAERPLRGDAGRVDWRLCGLLSRLLANGSFAGTLNDAALIPSRGCISAPRVLALGLGDAEGLASASLERFAQGAAERAIALGVNSIAVSPVLAGRRPRISPREGSLAILGGALACLGNHPAALRIHLLVRSSAVSEAVTALQEAAENVAHTSVVVSLGGSDPRSPRPPSRSAIGAPPRISPGPEPGGAGLT